MLESKSKKLTKKKNGKRIRYTVKYNQTLRNDWPEITADQWERLETDEAYKQVLVKMHSFAVSDY